MPKSPLPSNENDLVFVLLGDQLFDPKHLKSSGCKQVILIEDFGLCSEQKHHKLKLYLYLCAMREYRDELTRSNITVHYTELEDHDQKDDYFGRLTRQIEQLHPRQLNFFEVIDKPFESRLHQWLKDNQVDFVIHQSPGFLFSENDFRNATNRKKPYRLASFYRFAREKLNILIDIDGKPFGGKWSLDAENRKKIPKSLQIPSAPTAPRSKYHEPVSLIINRYFQDHPGTLENVWFPVTRKDAKTHLDAFLQQKFEVFGDYEDAMVHGEYFLFHSALSSSINIGLLTPALVVERALDYAQEKNISLNSLEGFIRQVIGWREFIRGIYREDSETQVQKNYWGHDRQLTDSWYSGETGILPLDDCIIGAQKTGYSHHIPRLMVICNLMNLSGVSPHQIYKWFMEMYIDSTEWVMIPNVYGMATFSDGGLMSTKPYTCGSNYILKMSNYKRGEWCNVVDGLYWRFIDRHQSFYQSNPRLGFQVTMLNKMDSSKKLELFDLADRFIDQNTC